MQGQTNYSEPGTAWYFLHGSPVMHRTPKTRRQSRFGTDVPGLKGNWHALNTTEFTVLATGGLEEKSLVLHTTALHRPQGQPGDDRTPRYPLPLHLARGMVDDWPESRI